MLTPQQYETLSSLIRKELTDPNYHIWRLSLLLSNLFEEFLESDHYIFYDWTQDRDTMGNFEEHPEAYLSTVDVSLEDKDNPDVITRAAQILFLNTKSKLEGNKYNWLQVEVVEKDRLYLKSVCGLLTPIH